jgi:peptidoglycan/LPS O-acetylase OafA/YrhL
VKLSHYTEDRDNNFNLIRIVAAFAVLITHSFALSIGTGTTEPFRDSLGMTMGSIAVDVFFMTSGFLVTGSLLARDSMLEFLWARALRVFPALLVMVLLTVFALGPLMTSWPLASYFADSQTYVYLVKCATVVSGVVYNLPGLFEDNPFKQAVNGSLWSLPYEIRMYAILAIAWAAWRVTKRAGLRMFAPTVVTAAVSAGLYVIARHFLRPSDDQFATLFFMFFLGAAFYVLRARIVLSRSWFWLSVVALLVSSMVDRHAFFLVYMLTIGYTVLYLAYIPSGFVRAYNRVGDYSYGVYIYAFPVQQSVVALTPGISVALLCVISAFVTLLFAALSWHLLERRALGFKELYVGWARRMLTASKPA